MTPIGAYIFLKTRQKDSKNDILKIEEEGRKAWLRSEVTDSTIEKNRLGADGRNYGVQVGRSGGGV